MVDLVAADLDGDGIAELVVVARSASVYARGPDGRYRVITGLSGGYDAPAAARVADLDLDGDLDVGVSSHGGYLGDELAVSWNLGALAFQSQVLMRASSPFLVAATLTTGGVPSLVAGHDPMVILDIDVATDADGDGLSANDEVCELGTDPTRADTDGGGTSDLDELLGLTDPLDPADD